MKRSTLSLFFDCQKHEDITVKALQCLHFLSITRGIMAYISTTYDISNNNNNNNNSNNNVHLLGHCCHLRPLSGGKSKSTSLK